jgi:hypothetical protein
MSSQQAHIRNVATALIVILCGVAPALGITIVVDYTYDTNNFFDTKPKRDALQAAADRFSAIITSPLAAVSPDDSMAGWRIGFTHPGTGEPFEISTAISAASDPIRPLSAAADVYGFEGLPADTWILYAGGRAQGSAGIGGTATGTNFSSTFDDFTGPFHRGLMPNTPSATVNDLPLWGGSISFDTNTLWHFGPEIPAPLDAVDFYSIALHEIGHALGLSARWNQWTDHVIGATYSGNNAVAAYNTDNSASLSGLNLESATDLHWQDGAYDSVIFPGGSPNYIGTVGAGNLQDLIMEPIAHTNQTVRRFELTNVDVSALADLGWTIASALDLDGDGVITNADVDAACADGGDIGPWLNELNSLTGDVDFDGRVQFSDFVVLADRFGAIGTYTQGDLDCDGQVQFSDFVILADGFGASVGGDVSSVPEPVGLIPVAASIVAAACGRRRKLRRRSRRDGPACRASAIASARTAPSPWPVVGEWGSRRAPRRQPSAPNPPGELTRGTWRGARAGRKRLL